MSGLVRSKVFALALSITMSSTLNAGTANAKTGPRGAQSPGFTWTTTIGAPTPGSPVVYDPALQRMVTFTGALLSPNNMWVWENAQWIRASSLGAQPSPSSSKPLCTRNRFPHNRGGESLVYDPAQNDVILFGGVGAGSDTWIWSGTSWSDVFTTVKPSSRGGASMAYDPVTRDIVLFGGSDGEYQDYNDTWMWNGSSWRQGSLATPSPSARQSAYLFYDNALGQMVLMGGTNPYGPPLGFETWTWDGTKWTQLVPTGITPGPIEQMLYDPTSGNLEALVVGKAGGPLQTWTWNGALWSQSTSSSQPSAAFFGAAFFDPKSQDVVLYGGGPSNGVSGEVGNETWEWNGSTWTQLSPSTYPLGRYSGSSVYDSATGTMVLFGGDGSSGLLNDTWVWNGAGWKNVTPAVSPPPRFNASMVYDPATGTVVLFGGDGVYGPLSDTWVWNGSTWTEMTGPTGPGARDGFSMVYDPAISRVILFGGEYQGTFLDDMWEWDGQRWSPLSVANGPSARANSSIVFDVASGDIVLVGGKDYSGYRNDAWTWNGLVWKSIESVPLPQFIQHLPDFSMTYDPVTKTVLLVNGDSSSAMQQESQTWILGGDSWLRGGPVNFSNGQPAMVFDPALKEVVLVDFFSGGYVGSDGVESMFLGNGMSWIQVPGINVVKDVNSSQGTGGNLSAENIAYDAELGGVVDLWPGMYDTGHAALWQLVENSNAPQRVAATSFGDGYTALHWTLSKNAGTFPTTGSFISVEPAGGQYFEGAGISSCIVRGLTNGRKYDVTIAAVNAADEVGNPTPPVVVTPFSPPRAPHNLRAVVRRLLVSVTWNPTPTPGGDPSVQYRISVMRSLGGSQSQLVDQWTLRTTSTRIALTRAGTYVIKVQVVTPGGSSAATVTHVAIRA